MDNLVSIITPCYNVSSTIERYFDSILSQTYKKLEIIAVDDGSTDNTSEIIKNYAGKFQASGMILKYIYQENKGLGSAINTGLQYLKGDFLCWSDPDDFYYPEAVEKRIKILLEHPEYGVVSSDADIYNYPDLTHPVRREASGLERRFEEKQFDLLLEEKSHFCAGCHMIRMSAFEEANPLHWIFPARRGQNWQLLLPVYYRFKRYYLDEPLYAYIVYPNSMSSGDITKQATISRWKEHEQIISETLQQIDMPEQERKYYLQHIHIRYAKKIFYTAIDYRDKPLLRKQYSFLCENNANDSKTDILYRRNYFMLCKLFYKIKDQLCRKSKEKGQNIPPNSK